MVFSFISKVMVDGGRQIGCGLSFWDSGSAAWGWSACGGISEPKKVVHGFAGHPVEFLQDGGWDGSTVDIAVVGFQRDAKRFTKRTFGHTHPPTLCFNVVSHLGPPFLKFPILGSDYTINHNMGKVNRKFLVLGKILLTEGKECNMMEP
jgi:hypothetical protein